MGKQIGTKMISEMMNAKKGGWALLWIGRVV